MATATDQTASAAGRETLDVIIIGAGLSGIGAAAHLQENCPGKSYLILEARADMGGTWDLFRYPGIRSDSDMHTLGYRFKPWRAAKAIADGPAILNYVKETADERGINPHIRYQHKLLKADWSETDALWTLSIDVGENQTTTLRCRMLLMCSGYYSYEQGYTPDFAGREDFTGPVVHPQHWPQDLDYRNKRVVIIGSGATAMTLAPAMAEQAAQVTVLQRSPTYVVSRPDKDTLANAMRSVLPETWAYAITRWKNVLLQQFIYRRSRTRPEQLKAKLLHMVSKELGPDYDVATHFTPSYNPWDQRLCLVPNADLFKSIRTGQTEMVTDHIERFTEQGIQLKSGQTLPADIIVTATGLNLKVLGGVSFSLDGKPLDFADTWSYKGLMYSGVPNLVFTFGYINASWTLRADLTAEFFCRLVNHLDETGTHSCRPRLRETDKAMTPRPFIDDFSAGYMQRMMHRFPKQGDREPWVNTQYYKRDRKLLRHGALEDGVLSFR
ncbi:FAD-containing monooxygenase EthA [Pseudohongiella acticola]|uniref:FAD-containing monooxygenase EthA n=1 Tax=Pseudohongiella acticola TaxID=1524254 RepID=A0A1E8CLA7_9GAMM|nr:NAD(P)/FAD-dependent oxidoreductase [Pseudohongiella acticola]OFE13047.1 FAD-containing monooxygenase EthA [Pseudohongiella acticola]